MLYVPDDLESLFRFTAVGNSALKAEYIEFTYEAFSKCTVLFLSDYGALCVVLDFSYNI